MTSTINLVSRDAWNARKLAVHVKDPSRAPFLSYDNVTGANFCVSGSLFAIKKFENGKAIEVVTNTADDELRKLAPNEDLPRVDYSGSIKVSAEDGRMLMEAYNAFIERVLRLPPDTQWALFKRRGLTKDGLEALCKPPVNEAMSTFGEGGSTYFMNVVMNGQFVRRNKLNERVTAAQYKAGAVQAGDIVVLPSCTVYTDAPNSEPVQDVFALVKDKAQRGKFAITLFCTRPKTGGVNLKARLHTVLVNTTETNAVPEAAAVQTYDEQVEETRAMWKNFIGAAPEPKRAKLTPAPPAVAVGAPRTFL